MSDHSNTADNHDHGMAHVMSIPMLLGTFAALIALTFFTVSVAEWELGGIDIWVALAIATLKALLVATYFMHLRYDKFFNVLLLVFSLVFVALFIGFSLLDSEQYQPQIEQYYNANAKVD